MDEVGRDEVTGRPLFVVSAATPDDIPASLPVPSPHFVCLLAWDARGVSAVDVGSVAERLLRAGCAYAVCWGRTASGSTTSSTGWNWSCGLTAPGP